MDVSSLSPRRRAVRRRLCVAISVATLCTGATACGSQTLDPNPGQASQAESLIEQAIHDIDTQPGQWQQVLQNTLGQLKSVDAVIEGQVSDLVNSAVGQAQSATLCVSDYFGSRVTQGLQQIVHDIDAKKPAPTPTPVVCDTNPSTAVVAGTTKLVTYYGYNLKTFSQQAPFQAVLKYGDGQVVESSFGHIDVVSPYEIEVEFQATDFSALDRARGPEVQLNWQNSTVGTYGQASSTLPVVLPAPPQHGVDQIEVQAHVPPGAILGGRDCRDFSQSYPIDTGQHLGAAIDRSQGDPGTPGVHQASDRNNIQANKTLTGFSILPDSDTEITVKGNMCGAANDGPGAVFDRVYDVYWVAPA
jgi:hypothetical protein